MSRELNKSHPLFRELRCDKLWHCTSPDEYHQILADGFIKPNDGRINKWGGCYACQELGAISTFDFATQSEALVLGEYHKWKQFLGSAKPLTIVLGLNREALPGKLIPYPESLKGTRGNVIPYVEVCHVGSIPIAAVVCHLFVHTADYSKFYSFDGLPDEEKLRTVSSEFSKIKPPVDPEAAMKLAKLNAMLQSPEYKAQMQRAKEAVQRSLNRKPKSPPTE